MLFSTFPSALAKDLKGEETETGPIEDKDLKVNLSTQMKYQIFGLVPSISFRAE